MTPGTDRWHSGSTGVAFLRKYESAKPATRRGRRKGEDDPTSRMPSRRKGVKRMIRKRAITFLGMALLVAFPGFASRAYADFAGDATTNQQECTADRGWLDLDINFCEYGAP
jgi:hypothetical protein